MDIERIAHEFMESSSERILKWAWDTFGETIVTTSSFQTQSVPLLHMISRMCPDMPVIFIDTGYHFAETLDFRDRLVQRFGLNIKIIDCEKENEEGTLPLYRVDPDQCCHNRKVIPMHQLLQRIEARAWVMGIRRNQTEQRSRISAIERGLDEIVRVYPLANWTKQEVWEYVDRYNLPVHPLLKKGYISIGCEPCTRAVNPGENERAGRWSWTGKTECGLLEPMARPCVVTQSE